MPKPEQSIWSTIEKQAQKPPGGDCIIGEFYRSLALLPTSHPFPHMVDDVLTQRPMTPQYATNLVFRAVQFLNLYDLHTPDYPAGFTDPKRWDEMFKTSLSDPQVLAHFAELLRTKETGTTIFQRYAGFPGLIRTICKSQPVKVADFGCGAHFGLPGLLTGEPFDPIDDTTPTQIVNASLNTARPHLEQILGIDKHDPFVDRQWRQACTYYPTEILAGKMEKVAKFEERIALPQRATFKQMNLLDEDGLPTDYDAVLLFTFLYQLNENQRSQALARAKQMVSQKRGTIIIQDFAYPDNDSSIGVSFTDNWGNSFTYRTFILLHNQANPLEVLQWNNGRCAHVQAGRDYDRFLSLVT